MSRLVGARCSPTMAVALCALIVAAGGVAIAAIPGPDGTISACYATGDGLKQLVTPIDQVTSVVTPKGTMRVVQPGESCGGGETRLSFNQTGPAGPAGPPGPAMPVYTRKPKSFKLPASGKFLVVATRKVEGGLYAVTATVRLQQFGRVTQFGYVECQVPGAGNATAASAKTDIGSARSVEHAVIPLVALYRANASNGSVSVRCRSFDVGGSTVNAQAEVVAQKVGA